jgi:hypothetical protein
MYLRGLLRGRQPSTVFTAPAPVDAQPATIE